MRLTHADLGTFASAVAARLPGEWTSEYARHDAYEDQFRTTEHLWDLGHVDYIVSHLVVGHEAVLHGPDGQRLYLTDRPSHPHQFVVAPLAPDVDTEYFLGVAEPNGIAVPADPVRATSQITLRLLPRYEQARSKVEVSLAAKPPASTPQPTKEAPATDLGREYLIPVSDNVTQLSSVLYPRHGPMERIADLFDNAAGEARAYDWGEDGDALHLADSLATAATGIRGIVEDLHVAPDLLAALATRAFKAAARAPTSPSARAPCLPPSPRTASRQPSR